MSRQYNAAGSIVKSVLFEGKSLKSLKIKGKVDYALACETLKYAAVIQSILLKSNISSNSLDIDNEGIFYVLIYELLFGKGIVNGGGKVKRKVVSILDKLKNALAMTMSEKGILNNDYSNLISSSVQLHENLPKYVRVNEIKLTIQRGVEIMQSLLNHSGIPHYIVAQDVHIPSLLQVPPQLKGLNNHPSVISGEFIIQDKASCFPSQILFDEYKQGDIVDCCAAPGNKTSHLAALMHKALDANDDNIKTIERRGNIYAFDKNLDRANLLKKRMIQASADSIVQVNNADFLRVNHEDELYANVEAVLVDPSCSGSGVVRALDRVIERTVPVKRQFSRSDESNKDKVTEESSYSRRILQLQSFQESIIQKAMLFPHVKTLVYSTCSIHEEENEAVVAHILENDTSKLWELKAPWRFRDWKRRGHQYPGLSANQSECLIRCDSSDGMNGFFVALFVKSNSQHTSGEVQFKSSFDNTCSMSNITPLPFRISNYVDSDNVNQTSSIKDITNKLVKKRAISDMIHYIDVDTRVPNKQIWRPMSKAKYF